MRIKNCRYFLIFGWICLYACILALLCACKENGSLPDDEKTQGAVLLPAAQEQDAVPAWQAQGEIDIACNALPQEQIYIDLCALGDIMAHNGTYEAAYRNGIYDFDYMFADIARHIAGADYCVANLETVFAGADRVFSNYPNFNTPEQMGQSLGKVLGLDLLSMANNHVFDRGYSGMQTTMAFLDEFGISHTGAYTSQEDYDSPFLVDIQGAKVAFISSTYGVNGAVPRDHPYAVRITSREELAACAQAAVDAGADCIVALLHWGNEYQPYASQQQRELAQWLFENTAVSLIIGNHAHVVQPIEVFDTEYQGQPKQGVVLYALGNFTGEQLKEYRDSGILARVGLAVTPGDPAQTEVTHITYTPTFIDPNPKVSGKRYRVISVYDAIAAYESGADSLISVKEYNRMLHYREYYAELLETHPLIRSSAAAE